MGLWTISGMARPAHDPEALARFQDGERRLVYARHKDRKGGDLYYLADGTAAEVRGWAREHLECFMPDCTERALKTVSRKRGRDGFSHLPGAGGHGLESLFHEQGKALVARWVAERYPDVRAVIEQATESGERRSDVMLTWKTGQQVAVEVQYAALTPAAWRARHESYRAQGIVDIWLWGHIRPHLREARKRAWEAPDDAAGRVALSPVHYEVLEAGLPLLWINPIEESIGTVWSEEWATEYGYDAVDIGPDGPWDVPPRWHEHGDRRAHFGADPLVACSLTSEGFASPLLASLMENVAAWKAVEDDRAGREAIRLAEVASREAAAEAKRRERAAADAERREREQAARAKREAEEAVFRTWWDAQQPAYQATWRTSEDAAWLRERYGTVPQIIWDRSGPEGGVLALTAHWHTVLYRRLIADQPAGHRWTVAEAYRVLTEAGLRLHPTNPSRRGGTVVGYLRYLSRQGLVRLARNGSSPRVDYVEVIADLERLAAEQARIEAGLVAREEALRIARERRLEQRLAREARIRDLRSSIAHRHQAPLAVASSTLPDLAVAAAKAEQALRCRRCGGPLDPVLADSGRHIGC